MTITGGEVRFDDVSRNFGDTAAVVDLSLRVAAGSFTALLGPSGCGKSTTLALLAGLLPPDRGDIALDGTSLLHLPAERRPVSLVFQKPLLFPHLSVEQNVGFGLRMRRVERREVRARVQAMLERVQLGGLGSRRVGELSGGQEQRVALARALVLSPRVLLLDEPFSQLDPALRTEMRHLVRDLHDETGTTTLFVTHDQTEAVDVADEIVLMLDGRLAGQGPPETFYREPPTLAAARFFGVTNEIAGRVERGRFTAGPLSVPVEHPPGAAVLVVRPEALRVGEGGDGGVVARVDSARFAGTHLVVDVSSGDLRLVLHLPTGTPITVGGELPVHVPPADCTLFPA